MQGKEVVKAGRDITERNITCNYMHAKQFKFNEREKSKRKGTNGGERKENTQGRAGKTNTFKEIVRNTIP